MARLVHVMRYLGPLFSCRKHQYMHCNVDLVHTPLKAWNLAHESDTFKNAYAGHAAFKDTARKATPLVVITGDRTFYHQLSGFVQPLGQSVNAD